jgi:hypothetical protein
MEAAQHTPEQRNHEEHEENHGDHEAIPFLRKEVLRVLRDELRELRGLLAVEGNWIRLRGIT